MSIFKPDLPKADMHVHLEGTITPRMARTLAEKNGVTLKDGLISEDSKSYTWKESADARESLTAFVAAYDDACAALKTAQDYTDITYDYLSRAAAEGCIYAELTISADHGAQLGLTYPAMVAAIAAGIDRAREEHGIEARMISTCVRHYGRDAAVQVGALTAQHPHPLVTGFGMAGDENAGTVEDFKEAFELSGLPNRTAHAGEAAGPESVRDARAHLRIRRFGHMVRAIEDANLMGELAAIRAVPEVCVSSNLALKVYDSYAAHPLRQLFKAGLKVTLGSDDPSFFRTSIGREYEIAQTHFGFSDAELLQLTRNAIEEAFVDEKTRLALLRRLDSAPQVAAQPRP